MAAPMRRAAPEAISIQVAAAVLCVSEKTIRRKIKSRELEAVKFGKLWRIPKDVLATLRRRRDAGEVLFASPASSLVVDQFTLDVARLVAMMLAAEDTIDLREKTLRQTGEMATDGDRLIGDASSALARSREHELSSSSNQLRHTSAFPSRT